MEKGHDYRITKLEKGPLQRFKNQNLLLKKFGETGLQVYKVITGKRTVQELRKDLDMNEEEFVTIVSYMEEAGMVELKELGIDESPAAEKEEETKEEVLAPTEQPEGEKKREREEELEEEIKPIGDREEEKSGEEAIEEKAEEKEDTFEKEEREKEILPDEGFAKIAPEEEISPVERIIKDRYGEVGLKVYALIDGQRTAEEIMQETGLSESKLVEILDFMDEQGIIKLEYPGERKKGYTTSGTIGRKETSEDFKPIVEETAETESGKEVAPVDLPVKAPVDIIKGVQIKAKLALRFSDKGSKIFEEINGRSDVIDMALKFNIPLYSVYDILGFLVGEGGAVLRPLSRTDVKKKYGDDAFSVYKKYGREGLMLYELIGKELTIKQMADMVTKDKAKVIDMLIFIHQILGIELPIDKDVLARQLGV